MGPCERALTYVDFVDYRDNGVFAFIIINYRDNQLAQAGQKPPIPRIVNSKNQEVAKNLQEAYYRLLFVNVCYFFCDKIVISIIIVSSFQSTAGLLFARNMPLHLHTIRFSLL